MIKGIIGLAVVVGEVEEALLRVGWDNSDSCCRVSKGDKRASRGGHGKG